MTIPRFYGLSVIESTGGGPAPDSLRWQSTRAGRIGQRGLRELRGELFFVHNDNINVKFGKHSLTRGAALSLRGVKRRSNLVGAHGYAPFLDSRFHGNDGRLLRSARNEM
jgi:hypothetical protein